MSKKASRSNGSGGDAKRPANVVISRYLALEQRVLLDAAALETAGKVLSDPSAGGADANQGSPDATALADAVLQVGMPAPGAQRDQSTTTEFLFIDSGVQDRDALLQGAGRTVEVIELSGDAWADQIAGALAGRQGDVSSIHLVSHGSAGQLNLGGTIVDVSSLDEYSVAWSAIAGALGEDGDFLLYGCDVASGVEGEAFIGALAQATGADVAASDDLTGAASRGGDWTLEATTGVVATGSLFGEASGYFNGVLADGWVEDVGEVSAGTTTGTASAATLMTYDQKEWKFVGQSGNNRVLIYSRNSSTGDWTLAQTVTNGASWSGAGSGGFGYDIAAAGNKLAVSAPTFNPDTSTDDGRVYVFTYNGADWTTTATETINFINPNMSGSGLRDRDNGGDNFGYSIDMAWNGNIGDTGGEYRLIVGNPNQDFDRGLGTTDRNDVGVAFVLRATGGGQFEDTPVSQISPMWDNSSVEGGQRFGEALAVGYDTGNGNWWGAVGASGRDLVYMYLNPTGTKWGSSLTNWGQTQGFSGWDSTGPNDISMHDDYMAIGKATLVEIYSLNAAGSSWSSINTISLGGNANVMIADLGRETAANTLISNKAAVILSFGGTNPATYAGRLNSSGVWTYDLVNNRFDTGVALDRVRARDAVGAGTGSSGSWHYSWSPVVQNDTYQTPAITEDVTTSIAGARVTGNDLDVNRDNTTSGVVFWMRLDEASGSTAATSGTAAAAATLSSTAQFTFDSTRGQVVNFTDGDARINLSPVVDLGASWTISSWYNGVQSLGGYRTLARGSDGGGLTGNHQIIINSGTNELGTWKNSAPGSGGVGAFNSSGYTLTAAQLTGWHHIVAVGEGSTTTFYIDGVKVGVSNFKPEDDVASVGNYLTGTQKFADYIDDFRIYDRALTRDEIMGVFGDALKVGSVSATSDYNAAVSVAANTIQYNPTGSTQIQSLRAGETLTDYVTVTVTDQQGKSEVSRLAVVVNGLNDIPTWSGLAPLSPFAQQQNAWVDADSDGVVDPAEFAGTVAYDFSAYFTDVDRDEDALLVYEATSLPAGWKAVPDTTDPRLLRIAVPVSATAGTYNVTIRARDPNGAYSTDTVTFSITLDVANDAPVVKAPIQDQVALAGYAYTYTIPASAFVDPDPKPYDVLTYTVTKADGSALPAWLVFNPQTRTLSGTPGVSDVGTISIKVTATDDAATKGRGVNKSVSDEFSLIVVNPAPKVLNPVYDGPAAYADFGFSVAISEDGSTLVVGAPGHNSIWYYLWNGSGWTYQNTINGPAANSKFGWSVDLSSDGRQLVVGARAETVTSSYSGSAVNYASAGAVYCYDRASTGVAFAQKGRIVESTPLQNDYFGTSVGINEAGNNVIIGASHYDYAGYSDSGAAFWVPFQSTAGTYTFAPNVLPKDPSDFDRFGTSVAFDQNIIVVSSVGDDNASGMVMRLGFDDVFGTYASPDFGAIGGSLSTEAQFAYDGTRGDVLYLTGSTGKVTLDSPVDLGASWTISTWYNMGGTSNTGFRTLTRGTSDHQIIIHAGTNALGVWNNSGTGTPWFNGADGVKEVQRLNLVATAGTFTITMPMATGWDVTTDPITWNATDATLATNIQNALNAVMGAGAVTVTVAATDSFNITFNAPGHKPQMTVNTAGLTGASHTVTTVTDGGGYVLTAAQLTGWHNLVAVGEGTTTTFYIDGVKVGTSSYKPTDDIVTVGNHGSGQRFADYLDDFRVYDRALSQSEIRNVYSQVGTNDSYYGDTGSIYVWSTDTNSQVAKLYAPDGRNGDMLGWSIDVDIYDYGSVTRMGGVIVASSIYNDQAATDGGAVYVWRSTGLQTGGTDYNGSLGNGTWRLESKLTSFDTTTGDYFGNDVAIDYDESTGGTRLLVGAPFEDAAGRYTGAVYAFKHTGNGSWLPEKFTDANPQGGTIASSEFFGNAVAVAGVDSTNFRAIMGARWRDNGGQINDGAVFWANLYTDGNYSQILSAETSAVDSYFLPAEQSEIVLLDTTSTQGDVSFDPEGRLVYTPGEAFKSLGLGQTASDSFVYVTEQGGVTTVNHVSVTVYGVDDAVVVGNDLVEVSASGLTMINVLANDYDPDATAGSTLHVQSVFGTLSAGRVYNAGTALVFDPKDQFGSLRAGEAAQEAFAYQVVDEGGQVRTGYVTLLVAGKEDPVVAVADSVTVKAGAVVTVDLLANDIDADGHSTIRLASVDASAALGQVTVNVDGTLSYVAGRAFAWLKPGETAVDRIVYTVRDDTGNESSAMLTILVIGENDAPTAHNDGVTAAAGETVTVDALANDVDPDGDTLRITRVIDSMTLGKVTLNDDGTISYTGPADLVTDRFEYEVVDSRGEVSTATVFVNWPVDPPDVPVLPGAVDDVAVTRGTDSVSIPVTDNDGGRTIVSLTVEGGNGTLSVGEGNTVVYTPNPELANLHSGRVFVDTFAYVVQYDDGSVGTASVRVYVNGTYVTPTIEDDEELVVAPKSAAEVAGAAVVAPEVPAARTEAAFALPESAAARIALDALSEFTAPDVSMVPQPAAVEPAPVGEGEGKEAAPAKPGLSAMLGRESQARRAGVDALLRHFNSSAA